MKFRFIMGNGRFDMELYSMYAYKSLKRVGSSRFNTVIRNGTP
jgi:hypothetical protein